MRAEGCALTSALTLNAQFLLQKRRSSFGNISMVFESYFREGCLKAINLGLMRTLQVPFMDNWQAHSEALYLFILEAPLLLRTHQLTGFWTGLMAANMLAAAQLAPCFHGRPALVHIHGAHSWRLRARREPFQCCRSWKKACNRCRSALPRPPSATSRLIIDSVAGFKLS